MPDLKQECKNFLADSLGRPLTSGETQGIIPAISHQMSVLATKDPIRWSSMTRQEQMSEAAAQVAANMQAEAKALRQRARLQVSAVERAQLAYKANADVGVYGYRSVARFINDVNKTFEGVRREYFSRIGSQLTDAIKFKFCGLYEDPTSSANVVKELFGEGTSDKAAKAFAEVVKETFDLQRERLNRAGANIGELEDWHLPQSHDWEKISRAASRINGRFHRFTPEQHREAWVNCILPLLDRSKYFDPQTGARMDDAAMIKMLEGVWETLVTDGNAGEYGSMVAGRGAGSRANRLSQHRAIHFKDAESYLKYEKLFGTGSITQTIVGRINANSRDIALMEAMGPNPNATYRTLKRIAESDAARARMNDTMGQAWRYADRNGVAGVSVDAVWATVNGDANMPAGTGRLASIMQGARNLAVAGKLGSAIISSFSDIPSYWVALGVNGINPLRTSFSLISMFSKSDREFAARAGIMADSISGSLGRFYEDNVGNGATAIMAEMTIRASGLNFWTQGIRQAFGLNLMAATGKLVKKADWDHLEAYDRMRLENHGLTKTDWDILRLAKTERYRGCDFITRESIEDISGADLEAAGFTVGQRDQALSKYLGFLANESYMASLEPNAITRAAQSRGYQKGTIDGEFWRSVMLFKSFPLGMVTQHFQRSHDLWGSGHKAGATAYAASVIVGTSIFGAISLQAANLLAGRDLQDPTTAKFWGNAMMKGGGLGVFGDMLYNGVFEESKYGSPNVLNFFGPIAGTAFDTWDAAMSMRDAALYDKETKWQQKALRLVRGNTPFINVWYAKMALDHAVFNDMNEMLSPGYIRRQRNKTAKNYGQGYWWDPQKVLPSRPPRIADQPQN